MKTARFVLCLMLVVNGLRLLAGDLTVEGDLNVTSNLACRTLSVTNVSLETLEVTGSAVFYGTVQGDGAGITNLPGVVYTQELSQAIAGATSSLANAQSLGVAIADLSVVSQSVASVASALATNTVGVSRTITINGDTQALADDVLFWVPPNPANVADFTYTTNAANEIVITGYSGPGGALVIPDTINGLPVTSIGASAFVGNSSVTSVSGGVNLASIETHAFDQAYSLVSVSLPSVKTLGADSFRNCSSLTSLSLPSVTELGEWEFEYCSSLVSVYLPHVTSIGSYSFRYCTALTSVSLPTVTSVGQDSFISCSSLTSVSFAGDAPTLGSGVYSGTDSAVNYVLNPTATGWGETFGGRPVVRVPVYGDGSHLTGITGTNIAPGSIGATSLAEGAVVSAALADSAVTSAKIVDGSVTGADLAAGAVGTNQLADGSVTAEKLADGSVGTNKAVMAEWVSWGDGRYISAASQDLSMNPGRVVAGYGLDLTNISVNAKGAEQRGYNSGIQRIGGISWGASQFGCNFGTLVIGTSAYGAEQRGSLAEGASATNSGKGSIQLLHLEEGQTALITGHASIGMGACLVTNDESIVTGDGLVSHGPGSITAIGFYGDGSGLTNLNLSGAVPTNSITTEELSDGAVTADKIADGSITDADIAADAAIAQSKIAGLTADLGDFEAHAANATNHVTQGERDTWNAKADAAAVTGIVAGATNGLLSITGDGSQLTGITAAKVGAYTTNETDAAISVALNLFSLDACVQTNHTGDVSVAGGLSVTGTVSAASFVGDGWGVTNLDLSAYVGGDNLVWESNKLKVVAGVDSNVVLEVINTIPELADGDDDSHWSGTAVNLDAAAGRNSLQLGSAATNDAAAFAPSDLSAYADGTTVVYSNGHFQVAGSLASSDVTNTVALAWPNLDTDASDDLPSSGGTMTGHLNMSSNRVMNLSPPEEDGDAISKAYLRAVLSALPPQGDLSMGSFTNGAPTVFPLSFVP